MKKYRNIRAYNKARNDIVAVNVAQTIAAVVALYFLFKFNFYAAGGFAIVVLLFGLALPETGTKD